MIFILAMLFLARILPQAMSLLLFLKVTAGAATPRPRSHFMKSIKMKMSTSPAMDYIPLGSSDMMVSKVCLGTMTWGQQNTMAEGIEQMNIAFDEYGINFMDTAEMYPVPTNPQTQGETDRIIAQWLKGRDRSKVILASKVSGASERITWLPGRNGDGARVSRKDILVSVDESLKRLGTDYIDLVQIHWPDRYVPLFGGAAYDQKLEREYYTFEEQLRAFADLIKAGKVRHGTFFYDNFLRCNILYCSRGGWPSSYSDLYSFSYCSLLPTVQIKARLYGYQTVSTCSYICINNICLL